MSLSHFFLSLLKLIVYVCFRSIVFNGAFHVVLVNISPFIMLSHSAVVLIVESLMLVSTISYQALNVNTTCCKLTDCAVSAHSVFIFRNESYSNERLFP